MKLALWITKKSRKKDFFLNVSYSVALSQRYRSKGLRSHRDISGPVQKVCKLVIDLNRKTRFQRYQYPMEHKEKSRGLSVETLMCVFVFYCYHCKHRIIIT